MTTKNMRNICIIAHVDHGKTTLVDFLLRQSGLFQSHQAVTDRVMDSMDLERERGITILAKNTSVRVKDHKINIVDTPGHADFAGEVERIMKMVDGSILLVDAAEGPLPQTRFVLQKSLAQGHKVILVINKVDRKECEDGQRIKEVLDQTFELFLELGATDEQADFPIIYACAREGWCTTNFDDIPLLIAKEKKATLEPLFDTVIENIKPPKKEFTDDKARLLVANLLYSDYVGQLSVGRLISGTLKKGQRIFRQGLSADQKPITQAFSITKLFTFEGLKHVDTDVAYEGDICLVAGCEDVEIGDTLAGDETQAPVPRIDVEKPTLSMIFSINTSPLSGQEGEAIQSRKLRDRLLREVRNNVALKFKDLDSPDQFRILGRGELQFAVLIEQMRREGFEFMIGKPVVLMKKDEETGAKLEPMERAVLDLPETAASDVTQLFQVRKGVLTKYELMSHTGGENSPSRVRLEFEIPTRGLLGMRSRFLTATKGEGIMTSELLGYGDYKGDIVHRQNGALIADRTGEAVEYALFALEERGVLFIGPGAKVYEGMLIGECSREDDLNVNPCKEKKLSNVRASGAEILVTLAGIKKMSLERCLEWIDDDEWIEVTPQSVRLRKKILAANQRSVKREKRLNIND